MRGSPSSLLSRLALWAIRLYQRRLSPLKGYSCAHRLATGGLSCSAYGHRAIARHGLATGLALLERRLQRCGEAHRSHTGSTASAHNPKLHYQRGDCDCGTCDIGDLAGCGGGDCGRSREHPGRRCEPFQRWREKRWNAKVERLQQERLERKRRERYQRERRGGAGNDAD